jgi:hypothetical protein
MEGMSAGPGALVAERELAGVVEQFQEWRTNRGKLERIPEALWRTAVALYPRYSVFRIARALRLNFVELRDRVRPTTTATGRVSRKNTRASMERLHFMELPAAAGGGSQSECHLKVRNGRGGTRITLRLKGCGVGQLLETLRELWSAAR